MTQAACRPYPGMSFVHSDGVNTVVGVTLRTPQPRSWRVNVLSPRGEVMQHIFSSDEGGPININVAPALELDGVD